MYFIDTFAQLLNMEPSGISRINPDIGVIEPVVTTSRRAIFPLPMPDGNGLLYAANPTTAELGLWWRANDGKTNRQLTSGDRRVRGAENFRRRSDTRGHTLRRAPVAHPHFYGSQCRWRNGPHRRVHGGSRSEVSPRQTSDSCSPHLGAAFAICGHRVSTVPMPVR